MDRPIKPQVISLKVLGYDKEVLQQKGFVLYDAEVTARTCYMHPNTRTQYPQFTVNTRYAQLLEAHTQVRALFKSIWMPQFPPKRLLGNKNPEFLETRIQQLNEYFEGILEFPDVRASEPLMKLLSPKLSVNVAVVGRPHLNTREFVKHFTHFPSSYRETGSLPIDLEVTQGLRRISQIGVIEVTEGIDTLKVIEELSQKYNAFVFCYTPDTQRETLSWFDHVCERFPAVLIDLTQDAFNEHVAYSVFYSVINQT